MQSKGSILMLVKDMKGLVELKNELIEAGFRAQITTNPKELLNASYRNAFQYLVVSMDAIDDKFLILLPQIEGFLGAATTLFCENPQASAGRLLKLNHPSKIYGTLTAKLVEQNFYQARMRALKSTRGNNNLQVPMRWDGLNIYNPRVADQIFGVPVQDVGPNAWKELNWLTILPVLQQGANGLMMVGVNEPNKGGLSKRVLANWLQSITDVNIIPAGAAMEFRAEDISPGGIITNPFFTVKGTKDNIFGLGLAPQAEGAPEPMREFEGYLAYAIDALRAGMIIDFDIFVHLPANDKFVRLVKAGTALDPAHHKHLFTSAREFHVKEEHRAQFRAFFTKLSLQQLFGGKKAA